MKRREVWMLGLTAAAVASGCTTTIGATPMEKRMAVLAMRDETLDELYRLRPEARSEVANAAGYAVFSNFNVAALVTISGGYGVAQEGKFATPVYMKMGEAGIGLALGAKDFRVVFLFKSHDVLQKFIYSGWEFGGQADAAAKADDKGGAAAGEALFSGITAYQLTKSGLTLQAAIKGTKYWKDDALN